MEILIKNNLRTRIYDFFTTRVVYHTLFWVTLLVFFILIDGTQQGFFFTLSNEIINILFFGTIVYFNLFYLIPNYLTKKKFITYSVLLILSAIIITPLKVIVFYFKFHNLPEIQAELIRQQNSYFLVTFFIAGSSTILKIITDWARQLKERQELHTQTMQSELRFLKSQINPHFLFNTLNNLYALTLKKSDKAPEIVLKLSEMMRYMLYECNEKRVLLTKEVNYLKNYLDLEKLRQGKNVDIHFEVKGEISDQKIAPLMFIPFLENSFKHGLSNQISNAFVNITLEVEQQKVTLFIENSKPESLPHQLHKRSGGIGLVNVKRRLNILYPEQYHLEIDDNPKTYIVTLILNLET